METIEGPMGDVLTTAKFDVKHDSTLDMYSVIVRLPKPNGPLVFGVTKEQLRELLQRLKKIFRE
jgi:hypothetical protein